LCPRPKHSKERNFYVMKKIKDIINVEKIKSIINVEKIKKIKDIVVTSIKNFVKKYPLQVKIVAALVLIALVFVLALSVDKALFPEREWEGFKPSQKEEVTSTTPEETTPEETTDDGIFNDSNIGEWLPVN
jgi:hypothetical protein